MIRIAITKRESVSLIASLCALAFTSVHAETIEIEAGQYLDVVQGKMVAPAVIVVEDDRIAAINPEARPARWMRTRV